ncbi:putative indole-3-pyruvate monooxygenase YUCCA10 [Carex littledalei]|uniref:Flavin-containing monooxygenase n=1 Tax=Carex littledalei TaxID=544730 RepID=A0A833R7E4_9POAL|nr:putative indole-3-pyruvate monooxygenase YUCCA10 [Carex littledalei]
MEEKANECQHQQEEVVLIVGAGPSGLAVAASLAEQAVPSLILERDDCIGSLWRKRSTVPFEDPFWALSGVGPARNGDVLEEYVGRYLVVAAGKFDAKVVPDVNGLESFKGVVIHSSEYRTGSAFKGKDVLVVGSGNSGMEIAFDLFEAGARTSVVVRSPIHTVTKEIWLFGLRLMKYLPMFIVDQIVLFLCYLRYCNTAKYGLTRPGFGPLYMLMLSYTHLIPVVDVGTYDRIIKTGEIQVLPSLTGIEGNMAIFSNGKTHHFDAIIFATGYRSTIQQWLETDEELIGDDGMPKNNYPNLWKGSKQQPLLHGFRRINLGGLSEDALLIANDISNDYVLSKEANVI